jgi:phage-related baseplate assembly protein
MTVGIDLSRIPAPQIIQQPSFEDELAARVAHLSQAAPALASALQLESEPLVQLLQSDTYRDVLLRQAVQDASKGNLLAFATGAMLDHLGAYYGVTRQVVQPADPTTIPPTPEILEDDARLRARIQLAPEGFTVAGPAGSYRFWAMSASPDIKDVGVTSPAPSQVLLTVLSAIGDGTPTQQMLDAVDAETDPRRPLTDFVTVQGARIVPYTLNATLTLFPGPDGNVVRQAAEDMARRFVDERHALGHDITVSGLHAALSPPGVHSVDLGGFTHLEIDEDEAAYCTALTVTIGGRDV